MHIKLCLKKKSTLTLFLYNSVKNKLDFNNFWYTESWRHLTVIVIHSSTTPEKCHHTTLWNAKLFEMIELIWFSTKIKQLWKITGNYVDHKLEFQTTSAKRADKSYFICTDTPLLCFYADLSPRCASFQPMFQQKADVAPTDFMHVMLFHCVWCIYQIILWIHRRATAKNFHHQKIILFLFTRKCQNAAENSEDNLLLKNDFFEFSRYSGFILQVRWTKAKLLMSNLFRILCTENYSNQFIFDWVIQYN